MISRHTKCLLILTLGWRVGSMLNIDPSGLVLTGMGWRSSYSPRLAPHACGMFVSAQRSLVILLS